MGCLIRNELYKAFRLKKLYLLMLLALAIETAAALQGKYGGAAYEATVSGQNFPLLLFDNLPYLFVLFAVVFVADSWVDEYRSGTLRLTMLCPVSRTAVLSAKAVSLFVCAAALMGFTLLSLYFVGALVFGWGGSTKIGELLLTLKAGAAALLPVFGFSLLVLFIAVLTDNMAVTVGCGMGLLFVSEILETSGGLCNYSIITMIHVFYKNLLLQFEWKSVIMNSVVIAAYILLFYFGSVLLFRKKDFLA